MTATGPVNGVTTPRSVTATVQVLTTGETTFSGLVLDEDAKPVKGALVKIGVVQVVTDDGGNFLMTNPPIGANQVLFIDGGPASTPQHNLPIIPYKVTIVAGQANVLSFVPHLHFQKTTGMVDISNAGVERIVTDPELPGFQMRIPAGAQISAGTASPILRCLSAGCPSIGSRCHRFPPGSLRPAPRRFGPRRMARPCDLPLCVRTK